MATYLRTDIRDYLAQAYVPHLPAPLQDALGDISSYALDGGMELVAPNIDCCSNYRLEGARWKLMDALQLVPGIGRDRSIDVGTMLFRGDIIADSPAGYRLFNDFQSRIDLYYPEQRYAKRQVNDTRRMPKLPVSLVKSLQEWWLDNDGQMDAPTFDEWKESIRRQRKAVFALR